MLEICREGSIDVKDVDGWLEVMTDAPNRCLMFTSIHLFINALCSPAYICLSMPYVHQHTSVYQCLMFTSIHLFINALCSPAYTCLSMPYVYNESSLRRHLHYTTVKYSQQMIYKLNNLIT